MVPPRRRTLAAGALGALALGGSSGLAAAEVRALRIVVPFPAGTGADASVRVLAQPLAELLGRPVLIENRDGGAGVRGTEYVARAVPDGDIVLAGSSGTMAMAPALFGTLPYDPVKSFVPVVLVATAPLVMVVSAASPWRGVAELVAAARARPGSVLYSSAGTGSATHLPAELFASYTQVRFGHIPQRSTAAAAEEVVGGSAHWTFSSPSAALPLIGNGQLRPIAITDARRNPLLPEVPTMAEAGVPRMEVQTWVGLYAPAGTPPPVVGRLHDAVARLLALPAVRERLQQQGLTPGGGAPGRLAELASAERAKWRTLVRERRIVAPTPD